MRKVVKIVLLLFLMGLPILMSAQPTDPDSWEEGKNVKDVDELPFDDGVSVLVVIGIFYGLWKVKAYKKNEKVTGHIQLN